MHICIANPGDYIFFFRRGRWSAVIVVMLFDSTGNGNMSEISEIVEKKIKDPGKFIDYQVDRSMASFRPQGGINNFILYNNFISISLPFPWGSNC